MDRTALSLLTTEQLSAELHVKPATIRRWTKAGRLPQRRVGRRLLYFAADVQAVLNRGTNQEPRR